MDINAFEKIVAENKDLNLLIHEHKFSVFANIKRTGQMTEEFIDWISPKYYDAFLAIYKRNIEKKQGFVCALLHITFLANSNTQQQLSKLLMPQVDRAIADISEFHAVIKKHKGDAILATKHLREPFNFLTTDILMGIETPDMLDKKEIFGIRLLEVSEIMRLFRPLNSPTEYGIYKQSIEILKKLGMHGEREVHVPKVKKTKKQQRIWQVIGITLIILIIILSLS